MEWLREKKKREKKDTIVINHTFLPPDLYHLVSFLTYLLRWLSLAHQGFLGG
jgi:hypothetical protein